MTWAYAAWTRVAWMCTNVGLPGVGGYRKCGISKALKNNNLLCPFEKKILLFSVKCCRIIILHLMQILKTTLAAHP
jgi:hypothetical protein